MVSSARAPRVTRPRAKRVAPPPKPIRSDASAPPACEAAQLAFVIMTRLKVSVWSQALERLAAEPDAARLVLLDDRQFDVLHANAHLLVHLSTSPAVTVVACPVCGEVGLHGGRAAPPKACYFTMRCPGRLVKAGQREAALPKAPAESPSTASSPEPAGTEPSAPSADRDQELEADEDETPAYDTEPPMVFDDRVGEEPATSDASYGAWDVPADDYGL